MFTIHDIQDRLIQAIYDSGKTILHIAKALDVPESDIKQYLSGESLPPLELFAKLCILLEKNANYLLCLDMVMPQEKVDMLLYLKADAQAC
ncbi:MAG: helix-turn-helix domain-containing protein [Clostridia bacterium]|nr:helix-turn-helix domain-containing protein [Clostridia bacterium]